MRITVCVRGAEIEFTESVEGDVSESGEADVRSALDALDMSVLFDRVLDRFSIECEPECDEEPRVPKVEPEPPDCVVRCLE